MSNEILGDNSRGQDDEVMAEVESLLASEESGRSSNSRRSEPHGCKEWIQTTINGQVVFAGLLAALLPGAMGALNGMGGGGNVDPTVLARGTTVSLATSAASYLLLCIPLFELGGLKVIGMGGWAYVLYPSAILYYSFYQDAHLITAASMLLGSGSALLWLGQGAIILSYPLAHQRARGIATYWVIYHLGTILSAVLSLVSNYHHPDHGTVANRTYVVFIWVALAGASLACYITDPWEVKRPDGAAPWPRPSGRSRSRSLEIFKREMLSILGLRHDRRVVMLLPLFFASSWFWSFQQTIQDWSGLDGVPRISSLVLFHGPECVGALITFVLIEHTRFQHHLRMLLLWLMLFVLSNLAILITIYEGSESEWMSISSIGSMSKAGALGLSVWYGLIDGLWQSTCYYLLGCLSSSPSSAARLVAVYKLCETISHSITHQMTTMRVTQEVQISLNWVMITVGLLCALPTMRRLDDPRSQDTSPRLPPEVVIEDLDGSMEMSRA